MEELARSHVQPLVWDAIRSHLPAAEEEEVRFARARRQRCAAALRRTRKATPLPQRTTPQQVARVVGRDLIRANADAHQEAAALAELLQGVVASNSASLHRLGLCSSTQRRMVRAASVLMQGKAASSP
jgi:hypothetical protein